MYGVHDVWTSQFAGAEAGAANRVLQYSYCSSARCVVLGFLVLRWFADMPCLVPWY